MRKPNAVLAWMMGPLKGWQASILAVLLTGVQFWAVENIKNGLRTQYDLELTIKMRAERAAEYLALARSLQAQASPSSQDIQRADQLAWELAMWLPADIYRSMALAAAAPSASNNAHTVVIALRKAMLGEQAGNLSATDDILVHGLGIGKSTKP